MRNRPHSPVRARSLASNSDWILPLWWLTTFRQWRNQGGALLIGLGAASLLFFAARTSAAGEPLYLTTLLLLATAAMVGSPLILSTESFLTSSRLGLLPMSAVARIFSRLLLGNSLRSLLAIVTLIWGVIVVATGTMDTAAAGAEVLQLASFLFLGIAVSQLLEDYIRLRRGVVIHQLLFLVGLSLWPLLIDFLRDSSNFMPAPAWAQGSVSAFLLNGSSSATGSLAVAIGYLLMAVAVVEMDTRFLRHYSGRSLPPPSSAKWTAATARLLAGASGEASPIFKEVLVPLRFLFLRMTLVFIALSAVAAFALGLPVLLLTISFWWQSLSTNLLGPDVSDGELRYALTGHSVAAVFHWRLLAMVVLSLAVVAAVAVVAVATGWMTTPRAGPDSLLIYPAALAYGVSVLPLWAVGGDRYSLRFADGLEMHTLLPDRTRSGGAGAVTILFLLWLATLTIATLILLLCLAVVLLVAPGSLDVFRVIAVALLASSGNWALYGVHIRSTRLLR